MASAPSEVVNRGALAPKLVAVTDSVPDTRGAGVVFINDGHLHRLRPPDARGVTVVYEWRQRPSAFAPQQGHRRIPAASARTPSRDAGSSPASEWINLGFNCGGAALAWVGVVGMSALTPFTGGAAGFGAALLYGGAIAASGQCAVSTFRTSNLYTGHQAWNTALDNSRLYVQTMRGLTSSAWWARVALSWS